MILWVICRLSIDFLKRFATLTNRSTDLIKGLVTLSWVSEVA
jgi:hypothetical protein